MLSWAGVGVVDVSSRSIEYCAWIRSYLFQNVYDSITRQGHLVFKFNRRYVEISASSLLTHLRFLFFLEQVPAQAASSQTAEEMALLAYNRALKLSKPGLDFGLCDFLSFDYGFCGFIMCVHLLAKQIWLTHL